MTPIRKVQVVQNSGQSSSNGSITVAQGTRWWLSRPPFPPRRFSAEQHAAETAAEHTGGNECAGE